MSYIIWHLILVVYCSPRLNGDILGDKNVERVKWLFWFNELFGETNNGRTENHEKPSKSYWKSIHDTPTSWNSCLSIFREKLKWFLRQICTKFQHLWNIFGIYSVFCVWTYNSKTGQIWDLATKTGSEISSIKKVQESKTNHHSISLFLIILTTWHYMIFIFNMWINNASNFA